MTVLSADRNTPRLDGDLHVQAVAAAVLIFGGAMLMRNAAGYLTKGQTALGLIGVGRASGLVDNSAGSAGDLDVEWEGGVFIYANSATTDEITIADIGKPCYAVDDQTVARTPGRTNGLATRSPAGIVVDVDSRGVHVLFDEQRLRAALAGHIVFVPCRVATLVGTGVYRAWSPVKGKVVNMISITEGVLTTADATLTGKIAGAAITGGVITIAYNGSAAGDKDYASPTDANDVAVGDELSLTVGGGQQTATVANCLFEIERA